MVIVTLTEYYSSQACFSCHKHIVHDKKKHDRVYFCEHCKRWCHRDLSSAIIHLMVTVCEIQGVRDAMLGQNLFKVTHTRQYSETDIVHFYRPRIYLHYNFFKKVKEWPTETHDKTTQTDLIVMINQSMQE